MASILNIKTPIKFDNSISKIEFHSYNPFLTSYDTSDEIRIAVQHQDLYLLPSESFLLIEGSLTEIVSPNTASLSNNAMSFLFDEIRYELNGIEIDRTRHTGITSALKNYVSLTPSESTMSYKAAWYPPESGQIAPNNGNFNFCVPLKLLLGFAEDYKKIMINAKHELVLIRSRTNANAMVTSSETSVPKLKISKIQWHMPHVTVADEEKLRLLKIVGSGQPIKMNFRSWDMYEYPILPTTNHHTWTIKTSNQLEKPRYIIVAFQTDRKNLYGKDSSQFDHCELTDIKAFLNSEKYPYNDMNIKYSHDQYTLLYDMYTRFQQSYYGNTNQPLLTWRAFKNNAPIVVIDCSRQNESVKAGPVDVKLEMKFSSNLNSKTTGYCLLLHDRIVEYNPLTSEVKKFT